MGWIPPRPPPPEVLERMRPDELKQFIREELQRLNSHIYMTDQAINIALALIGALGLIVGILAILI